LGWKARWSMYFDVLRLWTAISPEKEKQLWEQLASCYKPFIGEILNKYYEVPGMPLPRNNVRGGEIFLGEGNLILFYRIPVERNFIEAGYAGFDQEASRSFQSFRERIYGFFHSGTISTDLAWKYDNPRKSHFEMIRQMAVHHDLLPEEIPVATSMKELSLRETLAGIENSNQKIDMEKFKKIEEIGLIIKEYTVFCRKTDVRIGKISLDGPLEESTSRAFKCFACGKPIREEKIEETISLTPLGKRMLKNNYWLVVLIIDILKKAGLQDSDILVRSTDSSNITNIFLNHARNLIMFSIKDKEVIPEDLYVIFSSINFFKPDISAIITPFSISKDASLYLERFRASAIRILDAENLEENIIEFLHYVNRIEFYKTISAFEFLTRFKFENFIEEYLLRKVEKPDESQIAMITSREVISTDTSPEATDETFSAPESTFEITEISSEEASSAETVPIEGEEELPMEIIPFEDIVMERRPVEESQHAISMRIIEEIRSRKIGEQWKSIESLMQEICHLETFSCGLADKDGLLIIDLLNPRYDANLFSAVSVELNKNIQKSLEEFNFTGADTVSIEGEGIKLYLYDAGENLLFICEEKRKNYEEELAQIHPGEMLLRDAISKKVLEDLLTHSGIRGNLIVTRDGLTIDSLSREDAPEEDLLSALGSQILIDNERIIRRINMEPVKQIVINMHYLIISIIPLEKEGIFITMLEPGISKEIIQQKLISAANMLSSVFV